MEEADEMGDSGVWCACTLERVANCSVHRVL